MPEFYKYAERQAGSQVNWAGLGVDMAQTLNAEEQIREQKRGAIDDATNKLMEQLAAAPKGEALDGNKFVTDYSDNATQSLLIQHKLLKSGKLNPKDYMLYNANLKSGTDQLFNLQNEYQKQYSEKMARLKSADPKTRSQSLEADLMGHLEGFGNLTKSKAIINPATGQVNVGLMEYDKNNVLQPTNNIMTVQDVYKGIAQKFDYFDVMDASKTISDNLADVVLTSLKEGSMTKKGQLITVDYALQDPNTLKAMESYVDAYLENPYNVSSILTNDLKLYTNAFDNEGKSKGNKVIWKTDIYGSPSTEFTAEQKKAAKDFLMQQTKAQISRKEDVKQFESQALDAYNAYTNRINASKTTTSGSGTTLPDGQEWINYVSNKVPDVQQYSKMYGKNGMVDENVIQELNKNFQSLGLTFQQDAGKKGESIVIVDKDYDPPKMSTPIKLTDPNAQQQIIDYIATTKASVGKDLIATGVINKNVKNNTTTTGGINYGSK